MKMSHERYTKSAEARQQILDYLHVNPGTITPTIAAHFGLNKSTCAKRLADMCDSLELRRENRIHTYTVNGHETSTATYAYWPLVKETRNKMPVASPKGPPPKWLTRNTDPERPVRRCPDAMRGVGYRGMTYLEAAA